MPFTLPDARGYGIPPTAIFPSGHGSEGLAFHLEAPCLSLTMRVLMYNQEVLFLQGRDISEKLDRLTADCAAAAAATVRIGPDLVVCLREALAVASRPAAAAVGSRQAPAPGLIPGPAPGLIPGPAPGLIPGPAPRLILAPAVGLSPTPAVGLKQAPAVGLRPAAAFGATVQPGLSPVVGSVPAVAVAASDAMARLNTLVATGFGAPTTFTGELREKGGKDTGHIGNVIPPKDKDNISEVERGQAESVAEQLAQMKQNMATMMEELDALKRASRSAEKMKDYEEQRQGLRSSSATGERSHDQIDPKAHTAPVHNTGDMDGTNKARIRETTSNKRVGSPIITSHSDVEDSGQRRASQQTEDLHPNKRVKVDIESECGHGGF